MNRKTVLGFVLMGLAIGWAALWAQAVDAKATVYFLTYAAGCDCTKKECKLAEPLAEQIRTNLAPGIAYRHLDYGESADDVNALTEKYKVFSFPALLVVGADGASLFQAQGKLRHPDVLAKLKEIGVVNGKP